MHVKSEVNAANVILLSIYLMSAQTLSTDPRAPREIQMKVGPELSENHSTRHWTGHFGSDAVRFLPDVANKEETMIVPFYTRLWYLVQIELTDLAQHTAYLDPDFPKAGKPPPPRASRSRDPCTARYCTYFTTSSEHFH